LPSYAEVVGSPRGEDSVRAEQAAMVALLQGRPGGLRWAEIAAEVRAAGSAVAVWRWLMPPPVPGPAQEANALDAAARQIAQWAGHGVRLLSILDQEYPARLRQIPQAPPILFARGEMIPDDLAVSVIGSRQASGPGLDIAARVAQGLARRGVAVAAGLALGIDSAGRRGPYRGGRGYRDQPSVPGREPRPAGGDRPAGTGAVPVLAGGAGAQAQLPDAQRHDVRVRAGHRGGGGGRARRR